MFPPPSRLHANNRRKTDPPPAQLGFQNQEETSTLRSCRLKFESVTRHAFRKREIDPY